MQELQEMPKTSLGALNDFSPKPFVKKKKTTTTRHKTMQSAIGVIESSLRVAARDLEFVEERLNLEFQQSFDQKGKGAINPMGLLKRLEALQENLAPLQTDVEKVTSAKSELYKVSSRGGEGVEGEEGERMIRGRASSGFFFEFRRFEKTSGEERSSRFRTAHVGLILTRGI